VKRNRFIRDEPLSNFVQFSIPEIEFLPYADKAFVCTRLLVDSGKSNTMQSLHALCELALLFLVVCLGSGFPIHRTVKFCKLMRLVQICCFVVLRPACARFFVCLPLLAVRERERERERERAYRRLTSLELLGIMDRWCNG
jgi:hypothetical protein